MIPFIYVFCFVTTLTMQYAPRTDKLLVYEELYVVSGYEDYKKSFIPFSDTIEYSRGRTLLTLVTVKF